jgi:transcriptional regulator with XRE-family HTH domain
VTEQTAGSVAASVARTVRGERAARGWTLDALATRAGVSKGVLVALEQGTANPNLSTLLRVSEAFGLTLAALVQVDQDPPLRRLPADRQVALWHGERGGVGVLVAGTDPRPSLELWRWTLHPGETRESEAHGPGCREVVYVDGGALTVTVAGQPYPIAEGDAAVFRGDLPHAYGNGGAAVVRFTLAVLDPYQREP